MPDYRRPLVPGGTFFFTVVTSERRPVLCETDVRRALRAAVARVRAALPFTADAWVLLPDHLHCVWTLPAGDGDFSKRWGLLKAYTTRALARDLTGYEASPSRALRREGPLWQRRFWEHRIRDEADLRSHVDYLHYNPVKHGLVDRIGDWPWSSLHRYLREGLYPPGWATVSGLQPGALERSAGGADGKAALPGAVRTAHRAESACGSAPLELQEIEEREALDAHERLLGGLQHGELELEPAGGLGVVEVLDL